MSYYDRREDDLYRRINDFIYAERERQRNLIDPTRRILSKRRETVYMDKSPSGKYGMRLGTIVLAQSLGSEYVRILYPFIGTIYIEKPLVFVIRLTVSGAILNSQNI